MRKWFKFQNQEDPKVVDIEVLDFIGDWIDGWFDMGVTAKAFVDELNSLSASVQTIRVHVNSPGGDVFGAVNIANALRDQRASKGRTVVTIVDGLAASAASLLIQAGDPIQIADNAMVMVHNPWSGSVGDAVELRAAADQLDRLRDTIVATYRWHSKLSDKELIALMDASTWMDADEAIASGFATEKVEGLRAAASIDPANIERLGLKVPERFADRMAALTSTGPTPSDRLLLPRPGEESFTDRVATVVRGFTDRVMALVSQKAELEPAPAPEPAPAVVDDVPATYAEVIDLCRLAKLDLDFAAAIMVDENATRADMDRLVTAEKDRRAQELARQDELRALCQKFNLEDLAPDLISGGMSVEHARLHVAKIMAKLDKVEIDAGLSPENSGTKRAALNASEVYAARNAGADK